MRDLASPNGNRHTSTGKPEIVATYDYQDEAGALLYQVVRFKPKDFRQRKPAAGGGWEWKVGNVRRVPYGLPELTSADPGEWVYGCEGEKDVDRLRGIGLVATTNAGGAGKWTADLSQHLRDRRVVVLPDNDEPGRKHAAQVAASLQGIAREVRVVELPGLPIKGDVSDWLNAGGTVEDLRRLVDQAPPWKPEAVSFGDQVTAAAAARKPAPTPPPPWVPFPIEVFPEPVRSYVTGSAEAIGCDPAAVGTAILPALAAAIGNSRLVLLKAGWPEPAVLWGCLVGYSGDQKSPALDAGTKFVVRRQAAAIEVYKAARLEYERLVEEYKLDLDDWKRTGRKAGQAPPEAPVEPVCERWYCSDVTVEALAVVLQHARKLLAIRDELSGWVSSFDQYKGGRGGADTAHWLTIHGARDLVVDRKTSGTIFVRRAGVSIVGGIQPGTLRRVLGVEHFENGLAARLLLSYPPRRRKQWTEAAVDPALDSRVEEVFDWLYRLEPEIQDGTPEPVVVGLSQHGKAAWVEFYNRHAERIADATGNEAAVLSKIEGAAARIALVLHLVRQAAGDRDAGNAVDAADIRAGVTLAEWYANEAFRVYRLFEETDEDRSRREVVEFIQRRGGSVTARDLMRSFRKYGTADEAEAVLQNLADAGLGSFEVSQPGPIGGRPVRRFTLVDAVAVDRTPKNAGKDEVVSTSTLSTAPENEVASVPDEAELDRHEPTYCRGCRKLLIDTTAAVVAEFHWHAGVDSGDYCRECYEAGRVEDSTTGLRIKWHGSHYKIGTSLADFEEVVL